jgi:AcrR family transcriptional regulator
MARTSYTTPEGRRTREQLVRAAMEAFAARGYRGASLDTIAADVGVSRQGLLHYFPSKVELLLAVLALRDEQDTARLAVFRDRHDWSIRMTLGEIVRYNATRPGLGQLHTVLSSESVDPAHPAHDWFVDRYRSIRGNLAEWVAAEQASGRMRNTMSSERLAIIILAMLDGLQLQSLLEPDAVDSERVLDDIMQFVVAT